ncbi:CPBP family intramembrane glutamic endopeptidase [Streptomyces sp. NPDC057403]|uniref:CPBP family intramembrane glutamic endopeptidase n=1 Tax=Streptomyces sp. NPDC057403 TaxID=3346119 RepID=UPI0036A785B6
MPTVVALLAAAMAFGLPEPAARRAALFIIVTYGCFAAGAYGGWPSVVTTVLVFVAPAAVLCALDRKGRQQPPLPWLARGRVVPGTGWLAAATVVLSMLALIVWAFAVRPKPAPYLRTLQSWPWLWSVLGVLAFALVNPVWEEMLFRGVLLTELSALWGPRAAVVAQAALFGAAHYAGFPSGAVGVLMAGGWGFALGVMRLRTGGLAIPYAVHVVADAIIGMVAVAILR